MRIVVALGGNALLRRGETPDVGTQRGNVERAADAIAPIIQQHQAVITHGNGPQIGLLALQAAAIAGTNPDPLDILGVESEGLIGYLLELALVNALPDHPPQDCDRSKRRWLRRYINPSDTKARL
jgi:carbamate kinase